MIDPAIIDMMHHMSRQPPAIVQSVATESRGPGGKETKAKAASERHVREFERGVAEWVAACDRQMQELGRAYEAGPVQPHHLTMLSRMIEAFEADFNREATAYRRTEKRTRRLVKQSRVVSIEYQQAVRAQGERILDGLAQWGMARSNLILVLRALYAEHHPSGRGGPIFTDPRALGDYLRAAVA